ncbi:MAG: hypothetical protein JNG89_16195 [Planctomycetaceae bacterium]|nr:hypothetical protein [Planctomycetaceae bacterium]
MLGDHAVRGMWLGAILSLLVSGSALPAEDQLAAAVPGNGAAPQPVTTDPLVTLVNDAIRRNELRYLDVDVHTPWQIMHGILAYRNAYQLKSHGQKVSAVGYISNAARFRDEFWFEKTAFGGRGHPFSVPYAFEGHVNQFLAILTMCDLPLTHEFVVKDGQVVTMQEMVNHSQLFTSNNGETTWTLWFLSQYLEPDASWNNQAGEAWSMERLVRTQTQAPVLNAPCGGTHQLFALSLARNSYIRKYGRLTGAWLEADQKLQQHIAAAQALQNRDGSFSVQFFKGQEQSDEFEKRIKASGHMLEWLMAALPERRLKEYWVRRGIETLAYELIKNSSAGAEPGALYHAIHALVLYRERVAPAPIVPPPSPLSPQPEPGLAGDAPMPLRTAQEPSPIQLQSAVGDSAEQPPAPPLSERKAEQAMPILIDEAHPEGVNAPTDDSFEAPPPLPPRDARPLVIPNAVRLD